MPNDLNRLQSLLLKLPPVPQPHATAARPRVTDIDEEARRRIAELNAYDLELYRFSRSLVLEH